MGAALVVMQYRHVHSCSSTTPAQYRYSTCTHIYCCCVVWSHAYVGQCLSDTVRVHGRAVLPYHTHATTYHHMHDTIGSVCLAYGTLYMVAISVVAHCAMATICVTCVYTYIRSNHATAHMRSVSRETCVTCAHVQQQHACMCFCIMYTVSCRGETRLYDKH
jgi:hypothetical protein